MVFVLTNKLDVSVKEIRKTVAENHQEHQTRFEDLANDHKEKLEIFSNEIHELRSEVKVLECQSSSLEDDIHSQRIVINNLNCEFTFLS